MAHHETCSLGPLANPPRMVRRSAGLSSCFSRSNSDPRLPASSQHGGDRDKTEEDKKKIEKRWQNSCRENPWMTSPTNSTPRSSREGLLDPASRALGSLAYIRKRPRSRITAARHRAGGWAGGCGEGVRAAAAFLISVSSTLVMGVFSLQPSLLPIKSGID